MDPNMLERLRAAFRRLPRDVDDSLILLVGDLSNRPAWTYDRLFGFWDIHDKGCPASRYKIILVVDGATDDQTTSVHDTRKSDSVLVEGAYYKELGPILLALIAERDAEPVATAKSVPVGAWIMRDTPKAVRSPVVSIPFVVKEDEAEEEGETDDEESEDEEDGGDEDSPPSPAESVENLLAQVEVPVPEEGAGAEEPADVDDDDAVLEGSSGGPMTEEQPVAEPSAPEEAQASAGQSDEVPGERGVVSGDPTASPAPERVRRPRRSAQKKGRRRKVTNPASSGKPKSPVKDFVEREHGPYKDLPIAQAAEQMMPVAEALGVRTTLGSLKTRIWQLRKGYQRPSRTKVSSGKTKGSRRATSSRAQKALAPQQFVKSVWKDLPRNRHRALTMLKEQAASRGLGFSIEDLTSAYQLLRDSVGPKPVKTESNGNGVSHNGASHGEDAIIKDLVEAVLEASRPMVSDILRKRMSGIMARLAQKEAEAAEKETTISRLRSQLTQRAQELLAAAKE